MNHFYNFSFFFQFSKKSMPFLIFLYLFLFIFFIFARGPMSGFICKPLPGLEQLLAKCRALVWASQTPPLKMVQVQSVKAAAPLKPLLAMSKNTQFIARHKVGRLIVIKWNTCINLSLNVAHTYISSSLSIIFKPSNTRISSRPCSASTSLCHRVFQRVPKCFAVVTAHGLRVSSRSMHREFLGFPQPLVPQPLLGKESPLICWTPPGKCGVHPCSLSSQHQDLNSHCHLNRFFREPPNNKGWLHRLY